MENQPQFQPNIPQRKDSIAKWQLDMLANFSDLYNAFKKNHVALDEVTGSGNHTVIELPEQDTQFLTDVGEISVYSRNVTDYGNQIFLKYQGNTQEFQFTNYQLYSLEESAPENQTSFFTFLPGRVIVYFGTVDLTLFPVASGGKKPIPNQLILKPAIAKKIITINLCPLTDTLPIATHAYIPAVTIQQPVDGIYSVINIIDSEAFDSRLSRPREATLFYIVLANI